MRPEVNDILNASFATMLFEVAPHLNATYSTGSANLIGLMMYCSGIEYDRAADVRIRENETFRAIFRGAAEHLPSGDLKSRVTAAGMSQDKGYTVAALNDTNDELRRVLIPLHEYVEEADAPWARQTEKAILEALATSGKERAIAIPSM